MHNPTEIHVDLAKLRVEIQALEARLTALADYSKEPGANPVLARATHDQLTAVRRDLTARAREIRRRAHKALGLVVTDGD